METVLGLTVIYAVAWLTKYVWNNSVVSLGAAHIDMWVSVAFWLIVIFIINIIKFS